MNTIALLILDGWGIGKKTQGNPISQIPTPTFDWFKTNFPYLALQASGIAVGLPWGEPGSSEVGHLTLGAGRIVYQNRPLITQSIRNGSFFNNSLLFEIKNQITGYDSKLHLIGLVSEAVTNSDLEHLEAILKFIKDQGLENKTRFHLITDGKETLPQQAKQTIEKIKKIGIGKIASLAGRYYAMDTNEYWERTEKYLAMLLGRARTHSGYETILNQTYAKNLSDEFIEPQLIGTEEDKKDLILRENDAILFFNFRGEGMIQTAKALAQPDFNHFNLNRPNNLLIFSLTEYSKELGIKAIFRLAKTENHLSEVISKNNLRQLKLAESVKDKLITYYFNGQQEKPYENEFRVIIPSGKTIDLKKNYQLQTETLTSRLLQALEEGIYSLIVANFANPDLAGHQTDFEIGKKVVGYLDKTLNQISGAALKLKTPLIITSDHGNLEEMFNPITGQPDTKHNDNPVPFFLIDQRFYRPRTESEIKNNEKNPQGSLADIAPTVLELLGINKPEQMTGQSLIPFCR
ncbi:MAG: 2,3-bisphosphoglycerate-independent phosphoglycerate mutase [Patescibacteria group bacterium]